MDIVSGGQVGDNIIVSVAIPKEKVRVLCGIPESEDVIVSTLSEESIVGILKEEMK